MPNIGVVVIGRNEGERLQRCLMSVIRQDRDVVYVDSGSTDGSVAMAESMGVLVVRLDKGKVFTAARGRNTGFTCLLKNNSAIEYVQFVDGDCELIDGWLESAETFLQSHKNHAVVCGRLREKYPDLSIFNRLCDIEWNGPVGDIEACGGIFMGRATTYCEVEGMNVNLSAGEEPEMCFRMRGKGWLIARINSDMGWHDAALLKFKQWLKRSIRNGYGSAEVNEITNGKVFSTNVRRVRLWTLGWLLMLLGGGGGYFITGSRFMLFIAGLIFALYPLQILRIFCRVSSMEIGRKVALGYAVLMMVSKWPELYGQISYYCFRRKICGL